LVIDRAARAPARPASAAPPASRGVFARFTALPTLFAADPTLLAPFAAVSLTVPPTASIVLWPSRDALRPLRARVLERDPELLDDADRPRDEEERVPDELREPLLRELDVLRAFVAFVLLPPLLEPFREVRDLLLEPLEELRRLVLAFACAICLPPLSPLQFPGVLTGLSRLTRAIAGETAASVLALGR